MSHLWIFISRISAETLYCGDTGYLKPSSFMWRESSH